MITIGIDPHKSSLTAVAIDSTEPRQFSQLRFVSDHGLGRHVGDLHSQTKLRDGTR